MDMLTNMVGRMVTTAAKNGPDGKTTGEVVWAVMEAGKPVVYLAVDLDYARGAILRRLLTDVDIVL